MLALGLTIAPPLARDARAVTTANADAYAIDEDASLLVDAASGMLANDTDDGDAVLCVLSIDVSGLVGSIETYDPDGRFEFAPDPDWNGVTSFAYVVGTSTDARCDAESGAFATVTITVNPVNDAPTANPDSYQSLRDRPLNVAAPGVIRNDGYGDGDRLTAEKVTDPAHGTVTLSPDGAFSYAPADGYVGPDGFSYRASDGINLSPVRVVSITIAALPTAAPSVAPPPPTSSPTAAPPPSPTPTAEASASDEPESLMPSASTGASPGPSPSAAPGEAAADEGGGLSIPILVIGLLLVSLLVFGGAVYLPKLRAGSGGVPDDTGFDTEDGADFEDDHRGRP